MAKRKGVHVKGLLCDITGVLVESRLGLYIIIIIIIFIIIFIIIITIITIIIITGVLEEGRLGLYQSELRYFSV